LSIPDTLAFTASRTNLSYLIALLNGENYLQDNAYLNEIVTRRDSTYFVPNSAAALANFPSNLTKPVLDSLMAYHCVKGLYYSTELLNGTELTTFTGAKAFVTVDDDGSIYVNTAKVIDTNYLLYNGVMHVVDM
jgi:uncharacterized surface protein with fasciclin (FAS1) repeats